MEVALSIVQGGADAGLGIQSAATSCDLDFIPIAQEKFDLVIPIDRYQSPLFVPLREIVASEEFKKVVHEMGGYDTSHTGTTVFFR